MHIVICLKDFDTAPWLEGLRAALPDADIRVWTPGNPVPEARYALVWQPSQEFIDTHPGLRALFNIGAGVDAILRLRLPETLAVVRLSDAGMAVQMAEFVCHAVIRHFREFDIYERNIAEGRWGYRKPPVRSEFPVGVMGLGVLGERVARAVAGFEFPVLGWSRTPKQIEGVRCLSGAEGFETFLRETRILVCLLPLTDETRDLIDRRLLAKLKPGAYVINVARGAQLVDEDLLAMIEEGHVAGAALDVFRVEPLPEGHPYWRHPKIAVTPHTSARTLRSETLAQIAGKMLAMHRGESVAGIVDRARGY